LDDVRRLTSAIASGDAEAFARLYEAKFDYIYALARRATGLDESACLDIVQEAFLRAIRRMRTLDDAEALDRWLARVVRCAAYDHLRRERRRRRREAFAAGSTMMDPPEDEGLTERLAWLRSRLDRLDRASSEMLDLRFRAGMTLEAIGRRVGLTAGAVDGRIRRTVAKLRAEAPKDLGSHESED